VKKLSITRIGALAALCCMSPSAVLADTINVRVNGDPVYFEGAKPREMNGRVLVPLRGVLEKMGATVDWMPSSQTVVAAKGDMELNLPIGSRYATVNGRQVRLDVPAMTIAGSTMVPLRFVSEALGADVTWREASNTVLISTDGTGIASDDIDRRQARREYRREYRQAENNGRRMTLPTGTVIPVRLDEALSSNENREGDRFTATVVSGRDDAGLPEGTRIEGVVREAIAENNGKPGVLDLDIRRIVFPNESTKTITADVISLNGKNIDRKDGRLVASGSNRSNEQLKWVGIGAGAGLLISTLTKGNTLVDTLLGAGAGYLYSELQRKGASDVNLKAGTEFGVRLNKPLAFNAPRF
jgi:hypothetical protein